MIAFGSSRPSARTTSPALLVLFGALFAVLLVRTAWLSDQAYLTLRSVHHLSLGHGLRFNVAERVLVFDHPLWALLLATAHQVTGELYWTPLVLGILASALTVAMLLRQAPSDEHLVLCGIFLCLSPAFLTYSTSGLANPLVHLGLVVFLTIALKQPSSTPFGRSGYTIAGLTVLADPMTMLLMLPILGRDTAVRGLRRSLPLWALGLAPAVAWVAWASWYYGTPVPNPLTSALADQRAMSDRILAGLEYLQWSVSFDPVLALGLVLGGAAAWGTGGAQRWAVAGILAFIGAVLASGGDQWAGRLLTAPFLVAVLLQTRAPQLRPGLVTVLCGVAATAGFVASAPTLRSDADFGVGARRTRRPADQRRADYQATGLLLHRRDANVPVPEAAIRPPGLELSQNSVVVTQTPGFTGIKRGAGVHVIDPQGLTDPLLARLPAPVSPRRAGVQDRRIPDGYLDVLGGTGGRLADGTLSIYYDRIVESSRGGLAQPGRMSSAWRLATGQMDSLIRESSYGPRQIAVHDLSSRRDDGTLAEAAGVVPIREGGVLVTFDAPTSIQGLDLSVSGNAAYIITMLHGDSTVERQAVRADVWATGALVTRRLTFSARQLATSVRIQCGPVDGKCAIGHLRVTP